MKYPIGKILLTTLSAALGVFFVFSAYSKTEPVQYFEYIINSQLHLSHAVSAILARFVIGLEAALGLLLLISINGYRRWVPKLSLLLLVLFSLHLIYLWASQGNDVNCGCMGSIAPMSPAVSLLKNAGLIAGMAVLLRWHKPNDGAVLNIASFPVALIITALPFFLFPMKQQLSLPLSKLYSQDQAEKPTVELRKGKHVLCFMSLTCNHCRDAAGKLQKMKENNPSLPLYIIFPGVQDSTHADLLEDFMKETGARNIPHHFMEQKDFVDLLKLSGNDGVPTIFWMQDTTIIRKVTIPELNQKETEQWLK